MKHFFIIFILAILILSLAIKIIFYKLNYWDLIWENSKQQDFVKWILCDKYIAKKFALHNGFKIAKLYQYAKFPHQLIEPKNIPYVIKPVDLCNSGGVFLMKNGINLIDNKNYSFKNIQKNLVKLRSKIGQEYYMTTYMYNNIVPDTGYIIEELLLQNNQILEDYKCYTYQGKVWFIARTYNRRIVNGLQHFDSVWMTRDWKPIPFSMIKKGYTYQKLDKPEGFDNMINMVENISLKLNRHCRIDVYLKEGKTYFGEFTFFGGAFLHTKICNTILGLIWKIYPDNVNKDKDKLKKELIDLIPNEYKIKL
jgi:hypothetical protein